MRYEIARRFNCFSIMNLPNFGMLLTSGIPQPESAEGDFYQKFAHTMRKLGLCATGLLCTKVKLFHNFQNTLDQKCLKNRKLNIANILFVFFSEENIKKHSPQEEDKIRAKQRTFQQPQNTPNRGK